LADVTPDALAHKASHAVSVHPRYPTGSLVSALAPISLRVIPVALAHCAVLALEDEEAPHGESVSEVSQIPAQ